MTEYGKHGITSPTGNAERESLDILVEQYGNLLYRFIRSMTNDNADAQDILQETFIRAFKNIGRLEESENTGTWLHKIAYRLCLNSFRTKKRREGLEKDCFELENERIEGGTGYVETEILLKERAEAVRNAVRSLPEKQRTAIALFNWNGMKIAEIAEVMDCSEGAVMSHLHRARSSVREFLKIKFPNWEMEL